MQIRSLATSVISSKFAHIFSIVCMIFLVHDQAFAGFVELGASGSYRRTNLASNAYEVSRSLSGNMAYYFDEMSSIEVSYTESKSSRLVGALNPGDLDHLTILYYRMLGFDFVLTLGDKESVLRPYVKLGTAYLIEKRITEQFGDQAVSDRNDPSGLVPSAGAGVKIALSKQLTLRVGVDGWASQPIQKDSKSDIDYASRAGISWIF